MNRVGIAIFMAILLQPLIANAQICEALFSQGYAISTPSTYADLLNFSLVIILLVIAAVGIVYAIGYSMRINKLIAYSRTELLESVFNVIIIGVIVGGMGIVYAGMAFITNVVNAIISGAGSVAGIVANTQTFVSAQGIYTAVCNNYLGAAFGLVGLFINLYVTSMLSEILSSFKIMLMPNYGGFLMLTPGVILKPLGGIGPWALAISNIFNIATALVAIDVGIPLLLYFIYYVFPFFLYAGVLFRSFPWTRAAGGTMLALFISFYIVFPALLYPLSDVQTLQNIVQAIPSGGLTLTTNGWASLIAGTAFPDLGNLLANLVGALSNIALQIGSLIIALIISYDLVEMFGRLLGAPSARGTSLLRKVI